MPTSLVKVCEDHSKFLVSYYFIFHIHNQHFPLLLSITSIKMRYLVLVTPSMACFTCMLITQTFLDVLFILGGKILKFYKCLAYGENKTNSSLEMLEHVITKNRDTKYLVEAQEICFPQRLQVC